MFNKIKKSVKCSNVKKKKLFKCEILTTKTTDAQTELDLI